MCLGDFWSWVNNNGTGLEAVATVAAAIVAILALRTSTMDNRLRSQPTLTAGFEPAKDSDTTFDLVIQNAGPTPARDLVVTFDPAIILPSNAIGLVTPLLVRRYEKAIPILNPGQRLSNIWWSGMAAPGGKRVNAEPTPDDVTVTLEFSGIGKRRLKAVFPLTIETVTMTSYSISSDSTRGRLKTMDGSLKEIAAQLKLIAKK